VKAVLIGEFTQARFKIDSTVYVRLKLTMKKRKLPQADGIEGKGN